MVLLAVFQRHREGNTHVCSEVRGESSSLYIRILVCHTLHNQLDYLLSANNACRRGPFYMRQVVPIVYNIPNVFKAVLLIYAAVLLIILLLFLTDGTVSSPIGQRQSRRLVPALTGTLLEQTTAKLATTLSSLLWSIRRIPSLNAWCQGGFQPVSLLTSHHRSNTKSHETNI